MENKYRLNLGCGPNWKIQYSEYEGLDIKNYGQKYVGDVLKLLEGRNALGRFFEDSSYDEVMANHFLEHFNQEDVKKIIKGVWAILKKGGKFKFVVPHMDKGRSWILSHKTFWNEETVRWLEEKEANSVYGFGKWKVLELVTNERQDVHCLLEKMI